MGRRDERYADMAATAEFLRRMGDYLDGRNQAWLDRWQCRRTGEFPPGIAELANLWSADNHLLDWCRRHRLIDDSVVREGGLRHGQIGRLTALVYHRDERHRRAIGNELRAWLDGIEDEQRATMEGHDR